MQLFTRTRKGKVMDFDVDEEFGSDLSCPVCGEEYTPAGYQFQVCTICGHVNLNDAEITE